MKKQTKTYLLLGFVLIIWGVIGFKVVGVLSSDPQPEPVSVSVTDLPKHIVKKDTFSLLANYRDPFLGTLPKKKRTAKPKVVKKKEVPKKNITYLGTVTGSGTSNTLYFLSIDGKQYMLSKNEEVEQVKLLRGTEKQITVRYNGIQETVTLTE